MPTHPYSLGIAPVRRGWRFALGLLALAGVMLASLSACAAGTPPKLTISVEPFESGKVVYLPLAAPTKGMPETARLFLRLSIKNGEASQVTLNTLTLSFSNPQANTVTRPIHWRQSDGTYTPVQIDAGKTTLWWFQQPADEVILPVPAPSSVTLAVSAQGFPSATSVTLPLAAHQAPTPEGSFLFPARARDLRPGEYWNTHGDTHDMGNEGSQSFAYDFGVIGPDPQNTQKPWLLPGTDGTHNSDYRIWGKPIYALADGTVLEVVDGITTNPTPITSWKDQADLDAKLKAQQDTFWGSYVHGGSGNHFYIQHGDEVVLYAHMQLYTLATSLHNGSTVTAGQFLGLAGNSGNSTAPHLHIHAIKGTKPEQGPLRPLLFRDTFAIDRAALNPPGPSAPWFHLTAHGIPPVDAAIWPGAALPGAQEVAFHGVPEGRYQAEVDRITGSGYRLVWVDGYDVAGQTYFNVIFHPEDGTPWAAFHGLSAGDYQSKFDQLTAQGFRPLQVESYLSGGAVRYAAIYVKTSSPPIAAYHGASAAEHQRQFNMLTAQGFVAVNISAVTVAGERTYTALYEKRDVGAWVSADSLTVAEYQAKFDANSAAGLRLAYLNAFTYLGGPRITAIWYQNAPSGVARHGMSSDEYQQESDKEAAAGLLKRAVTGYEDGGQARFAALWTK